MEELRARLDAAERRLQETNGILQAQIAERNRMGAMNLLKKPYEMMVHTVYHPEGMKGI